MNSQIARQQKALATCKNRIEQAMEVGAAFQYAAWLSQQGRTAEAEDAYKAAEAARRDWESGLAPALRVMMDGVRLDK